MYEIDLGTFSTLQQPSADSIFFVENSSLESLVMLVNEAICYDGLQRSSVKISFPYEVLSTTSDRYRESMYRLLWNFLSHTRNTISNDIERPTTRPTSYGRPV